MLSGELGYDFLYAQLVGTVDALWTKAKNDSLLRQLADFRNQMAVKRASAPPKQYVLLPVHKEVKKTAVKRGKAQKASKAKKAKTSSSD